MVIPGYIPSLAKLGKTSANDLRGHFGKQSMNPLVYMPISLVLNFDGDLVSSETSI